jgi:hypothetical protein
MGPTADSDSTYVINFVVVAQLLTLYGDLLDDQQPIPQYALKLLSGLVEINPLFIGSLPGPLVPLLLKQFHPNHPNNNVHNVLMIRAMTRSALIEKTLLYSSGIIGKVNAVMAHAVKHNLRSFYLPLMDIMYELLLFAASHQPTKKKSRRKQEETEVRAEDGDDDDDDDGVGATESLVVNMDTLVSILATTGLDDSEWKSRERAAKCIYAMCRVFPQFHDVFFSPQNLRLVDQALVDTLAAASTTFSYRDQVAGVEATVLKTLLVVCRAHSKHAAYLSQPHNHSLLAHIKTLSSSPALVVNASTSSMAAMRASTAPTRADSLAKEILGLVSRSKS